jgi:glycosyltransferase involved in cell wall biosynthesis
MMTGVPVIATAHSCKFQLHWKLNDFVIANSRSTLNFHRRVNWVGNSVSDVVYCFTDLDRFQHVSPTRVQQIRSQLRVCDDDYLVGVVGQIAPRKGQLYLLRALPRMLAEVPHLKVALLGPYHRQWPYVQRLRAILMRQGLAGRVKWVGPKDNVQDYMQAFDVCVVPSLQEPLGLVAVEALAAGTPVVASRTGGLPEIVTHEATGLLVPRKNSDALSDAIVRLAGDPDLARQLAARGRAQVLQRFQPQELTRQVEAIYERVVANAKHRAGWQSMSGAGLTSP